MKVCVVTGSRAEYGLLQWVMHDLREDDAFELQVVVAGGHVSPQFGLTWREIERDGFPISAKVEMLLAGDTPVATAKAMALGTIGFAEAFDRLAPDLVMILGDRFEMLAAAQAALVARIPIAHIAGGDTTEGAFDEAIRHSITKMAHLHFVTNDDAARRVRQLGENPAHIHAVGSPGLDHLHRTRLLDRAGFAQAIGFELRPRNLLVTFHSVTLDDKPADEPFAELLAALGELGNDVGLIVTRPNADTFGRNLNHMIDAFAAGRANVSVHTSLGQLRYLSALAHVDAVVGNSSSGLYEAPSFKIPTVNVGDRQKGRLRAASVIDCPAEREAIARAIGAAFAMDCSAVVNPYGDGRSAEKIVAALRAAGDPRRLVKKHFFDLPA